MGSDRPVCPLCIKSFPVLGGNLCRSCGRPLISEVNVCTMCRNRAFQFDSHRSLFEYRGGVREMLFQLKFRGRRRAAVIMADLFAEELVRSYDGFPVVPVPSRRGSLLNSDHIGYVCRYLKRRHKVRVFKCLRRSGGVPQKGLGYEERLVNLGKQLVLLRGPEKDSTKVVLIDDIFTTGATADECCRRLKDGGFRVVHVLTFALDLP